MKIYLLFSDFFRDEELIGFFSSKERAEAAKKAFMEKMAESGDSEEEFGFNISEQEIDKMFYS